MAEGVPWIVQVCAAKGGCNTFYSGSVTVSQITSSVVSSLKSTIIDAANDLKKSGMCLFWFCL